MSSKSYNNRYEYITENLVGWLADFADKEADKLAQQNNVTADEIKNAGYMENILDIVNRNKRNSVEEKVAKYRELVGLDLVHDSMEKEGGKEVVAMKIPLSIRDKQAQVLNDTQKKEKAKQYVNEVIKNRNGVIATPALFDQLERFLRLDKDWLRANYDELNKIIEASREQFHPQQYDDIAINDLARTDDPSKGESRDPSPFLPPAKQSGV